MWFFTRLFSYLFRLSWGVYALQIRYGKMYSISPQTKYDQQCQTTYDQQCETTYDNKCETNYQERNWIGLLKMILKMFLKFIFKKCSWLLTFRKSFSKSGWESISINTVMEVGTCPFSNIHLKKIYKIIFNNLIKLHQAKNHFEDNFENDFETQ